MIELKTLAEKFEEELNKNLTGNIVYKIFTDTGTFTKAFRNRNTVTTVVNGIYSNVSSDISNVFISDAETDAGYIVATMTNEVVLVVPCKDDEESVYSTIHRPDGTTESELIEIGNNDYIQQIRKHLDDIAARTLYFKVDNYDVSVALTLADTGIREQLPELGDCFTFSIQGFYNIIENGDNSRRWQIYIDENILPYSSMSFQRQTTQETTVYANRGRSTSTLIVADTFSCGIEIPSLLMAFNESVKDFLLNGSNGRAHVARFVAGDKTIYKLIIFSESTATASGILNVGQKLQLNETKEEYGIISFDPHYYKIYRATKDITSYNERYIANTTYMLLCGNSFEEYDFYPVQNGNVTLPDIKKDSLMILPNGAAWAYTSTLWEEVQ
nr:MAG TPA: hypothetical protein [Caudoviricetes sp.]